MRQQQRSGSHHYVREYRVSHYRRVTLSLVNLPAHVVTHRKGYHSIVIISHRSHSIVKGRTGGTFLTPLLLQGGRQGSVFFFGRRHRYTTGTTHHIRVKLVCYSVQVTVTKVRRFSGVNELCHRCISLVLYVPFLLERVLVLGYSQMGITVTFVHTPIVRCSTVPLGYGVTMYSREKVMNLVLWQFTNSHRYLVVSRGAIVVATNGRDVLHFTRRFIHYATSITRTSLRLNNASHRRFRHTKKLHLSHLTSRRTVREGRSRRRPGQGAGVPWGPSSPISGGRSLARLRGLAPDGSSFCKAINYAYGTFVRLIRITRLLPPRFHDVFLVVLPRGSFFLGVFVSLWRGSALSP